MTAKEFLQWAGLKVSVVNLWYLGAYLGKKTSYFIQFPDADVLNEEGELLEKQANEPVNFRYFVEAIDSLYE